MRLNPKPEIRNPELPFVFINMSMTADGKIATANRVVSTFSSRRDHEHLLELRATADAVMCGARTADLNAINLGPGGAKHRKLRLQRGLAEFNQRIIVSGSGTLSPRAAIFSLSPSDGERARVRGRRGIDRKKSPILILTTAKAGAQRLKALRAVADAVKTFGEAELNFHAALAWLRREWKVKRLLCEGGGALNDALFRAGLVDELHLTLCPRIIGGRNAPTIADGAGFGKLAQAAQLQLESARRVGDELFLVYRKCKSPN
jgi:2,5-diamino-6-(ribosylamino)-4(3H)-pyrimidinone 5'-phosphate reductase